MKIIFKKLNNFKKLKAFVRLKYIDGKQATVMQFLLLIKIRIMYALQQRYFPVYYFKCPNVLTKGTPTVKQLGIY